MKDNFSKQAALYSVFRPTYPEELFNFILQHVKTRLIAWDCGTGNGQVAAALATYFDTVYATDISQNQLDRAIQKPNISYIKEEAENTHFNNQQFDLITVAQAIHWFDFEQFYTQVNRTLKPGGILAVIGYSLFNADHTTDLIIHNFYHHIIGPYWDKERKFIDEHYKTIPFPFKEIKAPEFTIELEWSFEQLTGYLNTWSAVEHYISRNGINPVEIVSEQLKANWGLNEKKKIKFPVLLRLGVTL